MNFQTMSNQRKFILIAAAVGVISVFLPWVTISMMGMSESINGFRGKGIVVFLSFIGAVIVSLLGDQTKSLEKNMWLIALGTGAIAFIFTIISFGDTSGGMGFVDAGNGVGIWLALIASLGVLASAWLYKNPGDNLKDGFESLTKNRFTVNSSVPPNKISELEKLIEMRNQGKITEEEYQQLKSKII